MVNGNLAQIVRASGALPYGNVTAAETRAADGYTASMVTVAAIGSALGRIATGVAEQRLAHLSVTVLLHVPCVVTAVAMLLFALIPAGHVGALAVPFFLQPLAYGATWAIAILCTRMMFPVDVGKHYGVVFGAGMVGIGGFNRGLFGSWYDSEARRLGSFPHCASPDCIRGPCLVLAAVNLVAAALAILMHVRWLRRNRDLDGDSARTEVGADY